MTADRTIIGWWDFPWKSSRRPSLPCFERTGQRGEQIVAGDDTWLDLQSGLWNATFGHNRADVAEAIARAVRVPNFGAILGHHAPISGLVSRWLLRQWHEPKGFVNYAVTGSQAMDRGIRLLGQLLAREYGGVRLVAVRGAYHGEFGFARFASSLTGVDSAGLGEGGMRRTLLPTPTCGQCPVKRDPNSCRAECLTPALSAIARSAGGVLLVLEPVQLTTGCMALPPAWFDRVATWQRLLGPRLLILADEVASGVGRVGTFFAHRRVHLQPDTVVLGKALAGGVVPLSALLLSERVATRLALAGVDTAGFGSTFDAYPVGLAAAQVVMRGWETRATARRVASLERVLVRVAEVARASVPSLLWTSVRGAAVAFHFVDEASAERFVQKAHRCRILLYHDAEQVLALPPVSCSPADLERQLISLVRRR